MFEDYSYKVSWLHHFPVKNYGGGGGRPEETTGFIGLNVVNESLIYTVFVAKQQNCQC